MLEDNVYPVGDGQRSKDRKIQGYDRYEELPDVGVAVAAAYFAYIHAVYAAYYRDGCESERGIRYEFD